MYDHYMTASWDHTLPSIVCASPQDTLNYPAALRGEDCTPSQAVYILHRYVVSFISTFALL